MQLFAAIILNFLDWSSDHRGLSTGGFSGEPDSRAYDHHATNSKKKKQNSCNKKLQLMLKQWYIDFPRAQWFEIIWTTDSHLWWFLVMFWPFDHFNKPLTLTWLSLRLWLDFVLFQFRQNHGESIVQDLSNYSKMSYWGHFRV